MLLLSFVWKLERNRYLTRYGQDWARKPGAKNPIRVSHVGGRNPSSWPIIYCFHVRVCISRNLDWKWSQCLNPSTSIQHRPAPINSDTRKIKIKRLYLMWFNWLFIWNENIVWNNSIKLVTVFQDTANILILVLQENFLQGKPWEWEMVPLPWIPERWFSFLWWILFTICLNWDWRTNPGATCEEIIVPECSQTWLYVIITWEAITKPNCPDHSRPTNPSPLAAKASNPLWVLQTT